MSRLTKTTGGNRIERKDLVESFSRHAKLSNKYILGLLFCCVVVAMNIDPDKTVKLPFIGDVSSEYYFLVSLALMTSLIILFSSSHLMAIRIQTYFYKFYPGPNNKDYFDLSVVPSIFRMAPISWMIKNKDIFFINRNQGNFKWKKIELRVYLLLKVLVLGLLYVFPTVVLIVVIIQSRIFDFYESVDGFIRFPLILMTILSGISFSIVWKNSFVHTFINVPKEAYK